MTKLPQWPGKSAAAADALEHPAVYHMLDVAAVAERLIAPFAFPAPLQDALVLLVALHDLGKVNQGFRRMLRREAAGSIYRHWEVTEVFLHHHDAILAPRLGSDWRPREASPTLLHPHDRWHSVAHHWGNSASRTSARSRGIQRPFPGPIPRGRRRRTSLCSP